MNNIIRTYTELCTIPNYSDRLEYLTLGNKIGDKTFGDDRYLNQIFYSSYEWEKLRNEVILRDSGCDLGVIGYDILDRIYIHHMNPIKSYDIIHRTDYLLNPEFLICTSFATHNSIHYGSDINNLMLNVTRSPNDMCPWKRRSKE